jgi:hypothetical protein
MLEGVATATRNGLTVTTTVIGDPSHPPGELDGLAGVISILLKEAVSSPVKQTDKIKRNAYAF